MPWLIGIVAAVVVLVVVGVEKVRAAPKTWQVQLVPGSTVPLSVKRGDSILVQAPKDGTWTPPAMTAVTMLATGPAVTVAATTPQALSLQVVASQGAATVECFAPPPAVAQSIAGLSVTIVG